MGRMKELWQEIIDRRTRILIQAGYDPQDADEIAHETVNLTDKGFEEKTKANVKARTECPF